MRIHVPAAAALLILVAVPPAAAITVVHEPKEATAPARSLGIETTSPAATGGPDGGGYT